MAFYTDPQGRVRPIRGGKGGTSAVAGVLVAAAVLGGGGVATLNGGTAASSAASAVTQQRTASSRAAARKGQFEVAWRRLGLKAGRRIAKKEPLGCVVHSFGQVRAFFARHPCRSLQRALLAFGDGHGNTIAVSIAWVRMPTATRAAQLRQLVDTYGTGNVSPIGGAILARQGIRFTGKYYASRRAGSLDVIAETAPARGTPDPAILLAAAHVAAELPPP